MRVKEVMQRNHYKPYSTDQIVKQYVSVGRRSMPKPRVNMILLGCSDVSSKFHTE